MESEMNYMLLIRDDGYQTSYVLFFFYAKEILSVIFFTAELSFFLAAFSFVIIDYNDARLCISLSRTVVLT